MKETSEDEALEAYSESRDFEIYRELLDESLAKVRAWDGTSVRDLRKMAVPAYDYAVQMAGAAPVDDERDIAPTMEYAVYEVNEALRVAAERSHPAIPDWAEVVACDAAGTLLIWKQEGHGVSVHELDEDEWKELVDAHAAGSGSQAE